MKIALVTVSLLVPAAHAEILDKSAAGFLVKHVVTVPGPPQQAYSAIVQVANWWRSSHTYSGDSKNLSIEAEAGGCFCEKVPPSGEVQHMIVVNALPGKLLRMSGALGPLQEAGVAGSLSFDLKAVANGTEVTMTYSAGGYYKGGMQVLAEPVDKVLGEQLNSLKASLTKSN